MEQTDKLIKGPSTWRTVGNVLDDLEQQRCWLRGETVPGDYQPAADSPLSTMLAAAKQIISAGQITLTEEQLSSLAEKVAPLIASQVAATISDSMGKLMAALSAAGSDLANLGKQNG